MAQLSTRDVDVLTHHVRQTLGDDPSGWPGGWPDSIESALIDAVFSVRARYGSRTRLTGVYGAVLRWQRLRGDGADDLRVLAAASEPELRATTNNGKLAGRSKAQVVVEAAGALVDVGVVHAGDFTTREEVARSAYLSVKGCGPVTWAYFRMLLGHDDVKPDTWVIRFVRDVLADVDQPARVSQLVHEVAGRMQVGPQELDHAIWRYQRSVAPKVG